MFQPGRSLLVPTRHLLVAFGLGLAVLAAGCGGGGDKNGYPPQVKENFINSCTSTGGDKAQCTCAWEEITDTFTYKEFVEIENELSAGTGGEELVPIIEKCLLG